MSNPIIDVFTVFGAVPPRTTEPGTAKLVASMDRLGVQRALTISTRGIYHSANAGNRETAANCGQSGGKLKVQTFFDGSLGADAAVLQQLRTGSVDILVTATSYLATVAPAAGVFDLPFLFADEKEADGVLDGKTGELIAQKIQAAGVVTLAYWENGFRNMTNSRRPIQRLEDMQNLKFRVLPTPVMLAAFKAMGAFAVPMPFPELYSALETKTVDGQENPTNLIESVKFYEVQKFLSVTNHVYSPWIVLVSKKWWDGLSKAEQKVLLDAARASRDFERKDTRDEATKALADLKAKGMQINELPAAEVARMRDKLTHVNASIATNIGMDLWKDTQTELAKIRAKK